MCTFLSTVQLQPQQLPPSRHSPPSLPPLPPRVSLTGRDDDVLGVGDGLDRLFHVDLCVGACDLLGFARAGGGGAEAAQDDVRQRPVHRLAGRRCGGQQGLAVLRGRARSSERMLIF